jgi:hypothetical protein
MTSTSIYEIPESQRIHFKPTFLYIKKHTITGKLYFGKTIKHDKRFEEYLGSGKHWTGHIRKHGVEFIETIWYCLYTDIDLLVEAALSLSNTMDIVLSESWANMTPETGLGGGITGSKYPNRAKISEESHLKMKESRKKADTPEFRSKYASIMANRSEEDKAITYKKISEAAKSRPGRKQTESTREKISKAITGKTKGRKQSPEHIAKRMKRFWDQ